MAYLYPYGDSQQLNLSWFLAKFKDLYEYVMNLDPGEASMDTILSRFTNQYDPTTTYVTGDYCIFDGYIYKANQTTSGMFNSGAWDPALPVNDIQGLRILISQLSQSVEDLEEGAVTNVQYTPGAATANGLLQKTVNGSASTVMTVDKEPTVNSQNPVKSGSVYEELAEIKGSINNIDNFSNKHFLIIGDSYNQIATPTKWSDIFTSILGITNKDVLSQGGYGFLPTNKTWLSLLQANTNIDDDSVTDILICGGANDSFYTLDPYLINAMTAFNNYVKTRFPNLKKIYIGFVGNSYLSNAQMANMRSALRYYVLGAKQLGWKYLHGIESTLFYAPYIQKISNDDMIHPNANGVTQIGLNIAQCLLTGSCENLHAANDISMTPDSTNFNSTPFNFSEKLNNNICAVTMGDKQLWCNVELSGSVVIARCAELQNVVRPYVFFNVYCTVPGETPFIGVLTFTDFTTLTLILPQTVPANKNLTIHGFTAVVDLMSY